MADFKETWWRFRLYVEAPDGIKYILAGTSAGYSQHSFEAFFARVCRKNDFEITSQFIDKLEEIPAVGNCVILRTIEGHRIFSISGQPVTGIYMDRIPDTKYTRECYKQGSKIPRNIRQYNSPESGDQAPWEPAKPAPQLPPPPPKIDWDELDWAEDVFICGLDMQWGEDGLEDHLRKEDAIA